MRLRLCNCQRLNTKQYIQMHSDYLNEDKICEMFQEDHDSGHKKQQISLNFTVTSRQSRCMPPIPTELAKPQFQFQQALSPNNHTSSMLWQSTDSLTMAQNELNKFNNWMHTLTKSSEQLIDDLSTLTTYAENNRSMALSMPDFQQIRRRCASNNNKCNDKNYNQPNSIRGNISNNEEVECGKCKKNDDLVQIIQEEYKIKVDECRAYSQQLERLGLIEIEFNKEIRSSLREALLEGVEMNLLRQQNESLNSQLITLKMQIDKSKLQKSSTMQKSTSLLKTKEILQKKLQSTNNLNLNMNFNPNSSSSHSNINSNTNTNSKLFSNAKYSTNAINPNDTINRVQSIICFGDSQPNLDELIRFYTEEVGAIKGRIRDIVADQQRRRNIRLNKQAKQVFITQTNQYKLSTLYKGIQSKLIEVKLFKEKCPLLFTGSIKQRKSEESDIVNIKTIAENEDLKRVISNLQKKLKGLQIENKNLQETNSDIKQSLSSLNKKVRENQQKFNKFKIEYNTLFHLHKTQQQLRKRLQIQIEQLKGSIRVYCRIRPKLGVQTKHKSILRCEEDNKIMKDDKEYEFDHVFNQKSDQHLVYQELKPLVEHAYDGKNLCVLSYGQTGSGKTYTMHGSDKNPGLALNIIKDLYEMIEKDKMQYEVGIWMTIVEIYKQEIRDLLFVNQKLEIKEHQVHGVYLEGIKPIRFQNKEQILEIYQNGIKNRTIGEMDMNLDSSRSHLIMTICIEKVCRKTKIPKSSKITLVDLAGAQKLTSSNPLVTKQTQFINKSLSCLVSVLSALRTKNQHVPYRESKLTHLLKESLSTKCNIVTIINVSPSELNTSETTNSLMFGMRARAIQRNSFGIVKGRDSTKQKQKEMRQNKENQKIRRASHRLSMNSQSLRNL